MNVQEISAITIRVSDMARSVRFYHEILGLEIYYGGEHAPFSSLRTKAGAPILNLEQGTLTTNWGRVIFHVKDVDELWVYLKEKGFHPDEPRDAPWGERYFHLHDPDGHELSFAKPLSSTDVAKARPVD